MACPPLVIMSSFVLETLYRAETTSSSSTRTECSVPHVVMISSALAGAVTAKPLMMVYSWVILPPALMMVSLACLMMESEVFGSSNQIAEDDVLDLEVLDAELDGGEEGDVGGVDDVGDVAQHEDLTGLLAQHGGLGDARVAASYPENVGSLALCAVLEELGVFGGDVGGPDLVGLEGGGELVVLRCCHGGGWKGYRSTGWYREGQCWLSVEEDVSRMYECMNGIAVDMV
jgi:hypothetical protein